MKNKLLLSSFYTSFLLLLFTSLSATISTCTVIDQPGTYYLTGDIINATNTTCMNITANDVILDCQGYRIDGDGSSATSDGIHIVRNSLMNVNITIKNCVITEWYDEGIYIVNASNVTIRDVTIKNNVWDGLYVEFSEYNVFENITLIGNTQNELIYLNYSILNNFYVTEHAKYGIWLDSSSYNNISNFILKNNSVDDTVGIYYTFYCYLCYNNILENITIINGISYGLVLEYSNDNTIKNITTNNNTYMGILLGSKSNNNKIFNVTSNYNVDPVYNQSTGIYIFNSTGNVLINITSMENDYDIIIDADVEADCNNYFENVILSGNRPFGYYNYSVNLKNQIFSHLTLCNADFSNITNITVIGSDTKKNNGFDIMFTENSTFSKITSNNNYYGIYFGKFSKNNNITDSTFLGNINGVFIHRSSNNTLINLRIENSEKEGIKIQESSYNVIDSSIIKNNSVGVYLIVPSFGPIRSYNTIKNSRIENNNNYGIHIENEDNTLVYNNFFNNSINVYFAGTIYPNSWNTTKQSGTNIVNGPYIAGNFWALPNGTGFSETCLDSNNDGICDQAYNITTGTACIPGINCGNNVDFLPLAIYISPFKILIQKPNSFQILYNNQTQTITATINTNLQSCTISSKIPKNKFSKISLTCCKNNYLNLYINSSLVNQTSCSGNITSSLSPIYIGGNQSGYTFKGIIDELHILNTSSYDPTRYYKLSAIIYNPLTVTLEGIYILAKVAGKTYIKYDTSFLQPSSFLVTSLFVPSGKISLLEVSPKNCPISVSLTNVAECG